MKAFGDYGETIGGVVLGIIPPVATNALGLDKTLQMIPQTASIVRAMTLIGGTLGLALGHYVRVTRIDLKARIIFAIANGVISALLWLADYSLVTWATVSGNTEGWTVILSALLVFLIFVGWCTLATLAGVIAARPATH